MQPARIAYRRSRLRNELNRDVLPSTRKPDRLVTSPQLLYQGHVLTRILHIQRKRGAELSGQSEIRLGAFFFFFFFATIPDFSSGKPRPATYSTGELSSPKTANVGVPSVWAVIFEFMDIQFLCAPGGVSVSSQHSSRWGCLGYEH